MIRPLVLAALLPALTAGCAVVPMLPDSKTCHAESAIGYIGQRYTPRIGRIVKAKTQATYVRALTPDTIVTQEFRANRVNVSVDDKGIVTRVYCG